MDDNSIKTSRLCFRKQLKVLIMAVIYIYIYNIYVGFPLSRPKLGREEGKWTLHSVIVSFMLTDHSQMLYVFILKPDLFNINMQKWFDVYCPQLLLRADPLSKPRLSCSCWTSKQVSDRFSVLEGSAFLTDDSTWPQHACFRLKSGLLTSKLRMWSVEPGPFSGQHSDVENAAVSQNNHLLQGFTLLQPPPPKKNSAVLIS